MYDYKQVAEILDKYYDYKHKLRKYQNKNKQKQEYYSKNLKIIKKKMEKNMDNFTFYDENMKIINHKKKEKIEQFITGNLIEPTDIVLELGARYGTVSCTINRILNIKTNQVSVEPDQRIINALEYNKKINKSNFHIINGFISKRKLGLVHKEAFDGYGTKSKPDELSTIKNYSLEEIEHKYNLKFNVFVADCEGCLEDFFSENPNFPKNLRLIIYEKDYSKHCDYDKIEKNLEKNFKHVIKGEQNVWIKK